MAKTLFMSSTVDIK